MIQPFLFGSICLVSRDPQACRVQWSIMYHRDSKHLTFKTLIYTYYSKKEIDVTHSLFPNTFLEFFSCLAHHGFWKFRPSGPFGPFFGHLSRWAAWSNKGPVEFESVELRGAVQLILEYILYILYIHIPRPSKGNTNFSPKRSGFGRFFGAQISDLWRIQVYILVFAVVDVVCNLLF